uniref:Retrovirus-related Pol polyprotein LINE-1 n=1 Tax=Cajanus cajan TaxID=3821 RepID=A0A151S8Y9_CAJCA|nr:Retrovirus-related Pol polyprotein LINE-1 [Cajanus cajan]
MQAFDGFIQEAFLVDLPLHGRKYTWYKSGGSCMSRLDRFLVLDGWLAAWSNTVQWGPERGVSDHCAVLLKNEEVNWGPKPFRVLDCWQNDVRYGAFVKSQWREIVVSGRAAFVLKEKLKNLKIKLRTWNKDTFGDLDRKISEARDNFNKLDLKSEVSNLQEEDVLQNEIRSLEVANERYYEPSAIKEAVTGFYEKYFEERSSNRLFLNDPTFKFLQEDEAASLILPFTEEEVKNAVWDCDRSKSPGPDGFNFNFIKDFWEIIKYDFMAFIHEFHAYGKLVKGSNSSFVVLVPKIDNPQKVEEYRPISLIGCMYKVLAKLLANRLRIVIGSVISECQSSFVKGRLIFDGVVVANEILEETKRKKQACLFFKVDFEKAYDSVSWNFLLFVIERMSPSKWRRGLRQGDPLAPFLFLLVAEGLNSLMTKAIQMQVFKGYSAGRDGIPISLLQ